MRGAVEHFYRPTGRGRELFHAVAGPPYLAEGEMAVVRPEGGGRFSVIARIPLAEW